MTDRATITIGMVLFPRLTQLDLTGPCEVFARMPNTVVQLVAETHEPCGASLTGDHADHHVRRCAAIRPAVCPGGIGVNAMMEHPPLLDFLRAQAMQARYVISVCTGGLLLGAAGLLQGYRATPHWLVLDLLPILGAEPMPERVVTDRNRVTGGGVTAGIDFGLAVAAGLCGVAVAARIRERRREIAAHAAARLKYTA